MPRVSDAKEKLTDAARDLIWENSYGATSVDDICSKAEVKKGSFYHFFKSKADLEVAALDTEWAESRQKLDGVFSPVVPPLERFEQFFASTYACQKAQQEECGSVLGCPLFTIGCEICTQEESIREKVHSILTGYMKYFEFAIRDAHEEGWISAPDAQAKAKALFAYFQGTLTQARIENNPELLRSLKDGAFAMLGVKRPEPAAA